MIAKKLEIENISIEELEMLIRKVTREEIQNVSHSENKNNQYTTEEKMIPRKKFLKMIGKSESWLSKNMRDNKIPFHKVRRSIFFNLEEVLQNSTITEIKKKLRCKHE